MSTLDIEQYKKALVNKTFKILPLREESKDWQRYLEGLIVEISGAQKLFDENVDFIILLSKLQGLYEIEELALFRKVIFDSITLINSL